MIKFIEAIVKFAEKALDTGKTVIDSLDEEKFGDAVNIFCGEEPPLSEWDAAIEMIKADETKSTEEKIQLIKLVSDEKEKRTRASQERKVTAAKQIDEHIEKKAGIAKDVTLGILSGGLSMIPKAVNALRESGERTEAKMLPDDNVVAESTDIDE